MNVKSYYSKFIILIVSLLMSGCNYGASEKFNSDQTIAPTHFQKDIIDRARNWIVESVDYSTDEPSNDNYPVEGYRPDCSGYISYAWQGPKHRSPYTENLNNYAVILPSVDDLKPGDALNNARGQKEGHAVLFVKWEDKDKKIFIAYEQNGVIGHAVEARLQLVPIEGGYTIKDLRYPNKPLFEVYGAPGPYYPIRRNFIPPYSSSQQVLGISTTQSPAASNNSETVLVLDTSGSMLGYDSSGIIKIDMAKKAAGNLLDVIKTEQQAFGASIQHSVGLVAFESFASIHYTLTEDISAVQNALWELSVGDLTAMASGLQQGIDLLDTSSMAKQMIVLLSDGVPNVPINYTLEMDYEGINQEVILIGQQAGSKGICVYTIGLGDPQALPEAEGYFDEQLLSDIAAASGCGQYYNAQNAGELANVFIQLRHASMGTVLMQQSGQITQDEQLQLGNVQVPKNQEQMLFTLNWPGSKLSPQIVDPRGRRVDKNYPGATISQGSTITSVIVVDPIPGIWQVTIIGEQVPGGVTTYNAVMSTRGRAVTSTPAWFWLTLIVLAVSSLGTVTYIATTARGRRKRRVTSGRAYLLATAGPLKGQRIPLSRDFLIGRKPGCHLVIPDLTVSRVHARIHNAKGMWYIQDQGSKAGVIINNKRVNAYRLKSGDSIMLGDTTFTFFRR